MFDREVEEKEKRWSWELKGSCWEGGWLSGEVEGGGASADGIGVVAVRHAVAALFTLCVFVGTAGQMELRSHEMTHAKFT